MGDVDGEGPLHVVVGVGCCGGVPCRGGDRLGGLEHLRAQVLDRLEGPDPLAELLPHLGVVDGGLQAPPGHACRLGRSQGHGQQSASRLAVGAGRTVRAGVAGAEVDAELRCDLARPVEQVVLGRRATVPDRAARVHLHPVATRRTRQDAADRRAEEATGKQLVGAGLQRDRLVEDGPAPTATGFGHRDRRHAHLLDGRPDGGEVRLRVALGCPHGLDRPEAGGPLAQVVGELDLLVGDAE